MTTNNIRVPLALAALGCSTAIALAGLAMFSPNLKDNPMTLQAVIISAIGIGITGLTAAGTAYQTQVKAESSSSVVVTDNNGTQQVISSDPPATQTQVLNTDHQEVVEAPSYSYLPPNNLEPLPVPLPELEEDWEEPNKQSSRNQSYFPGE